jgi:hypothetical protein
VKLIKHLKKLKTKLEVNYLEGLSIAKEPYELEREALLQAGASALQAGVEGETRGAAAVAGQVLDGSASRGSRTKSGNVTEKCNNYSS